MLPQRNYPRAILFFRTREFEIGELEYFINPQFASWRMGKYLRCGWWKLNAGGKMSCKSTWIIWSGMRFRTGKGRITANAQWILNINFLLAWTNFTVSLIARILTSPPRKSERAGFALHRSGNWREIFYRMSLSRLLASTACFWCVFWKLIMKRRLRLPKKGETEKRVVMKFPKHLAPIQVAVLPLSKKEELAKVAKPLASECAENFRWIMMKPRASASAIAGKMKSARLIALPWILNHWKIKSYRPRSG